MLGNTRRVVLGSGAREYYMYARFTVVSEEEFKIALPDIVVNGERYTVPVVTFRKRTGFGIGPVNC
jgi:hypothetical protein